MTAYVFTQKLIPSRTQKFFWISKRTFQFQIQFGCLSYFQLNKLCFALVFRFFGEGGGIIFPVLIKFQEKQILFDIFLGGKVDFFIPTPYSQFMSIQVTNKIAMPWVIWKCPKSLWWVGGGGQVVGRWCKPILVFIFCPLVKLNNDKPFSV